MYVRQKRDYMSLSSLGCLGVSAGPCDIVEDDEVYIAIYECNWIEVYNQNGERIRTIGNYSYWSG